MDICWIYARDALFHSEEDPCTDMSLIKAKNWEDTNGLTLPSGSVCKLLSLCEKVVRQHVNSLSTPKIEDVMLMEVIGKLNSNHIFPNLAIFHSLETGIGCDNHYTTLVHLISRKYLRLRIKKLCRDSALKRSHGNSLLRSRVFLGL